MIYDMDIIETRETSFHYFVFAFGPFMETFMSEMPRNMRWTGLCMLYPILCAWVLAGCAIGRTYEGSPLPAETPQRIIAGKTTKSEILKELGPPQEIFPQKTGFIFVYRYSQTNEFLLILQEPVFSRKVFFKFEKSTEKSNSLAVLFNQEGVVQSYGWEEDIPNLPFL